MRPNLVELEVCQNCSQHSFHTRHKAVDKYQTLKVQFTKLFKDLGFVVRKASKTPRIGSFQIKINGKLIFSKLQSKQFPNLKLFQKLTFKKCQDKVVQTYDIVEAKRLQSLVWTGGTTLLLQALIERVALQTEAILAVGLRLGKIQTLSKTFERQHALGKFPDLVQIFLQARLVQTRRLQVLIKIVSEARQQAESFQLTDQFLKGAKEQRVQFRFSNAVVTVLLRSYFKMQFIKTQSTVVRS